MNHKRFQSFIQLRNASPWIAKFLFVTIISLSFFQFIPYERVGAQTVDTRIQDSSLDTLINETSTLLNELKYFSFTCPTTKFKSALQNVSTIKSYVQDYAVVNKQSYLTKVQIYETQLKLYHYFSCVFAGRIPFSTVSPFQSPSYGSAISSGDFTTYALYLKNALNTKYDIRTERATLTSSLQFKNINFNRDINHLSFITKYGVTALNSLLSERYGKSFLTWLFENPDVMNQFLLGGDPSGGNALQALKIWMNIWSTDPESTRSLYLTLAQAVALEHARPLYTGWYQVNEKNEATLLNPLSRYLNFKQAHKAKKLYPVFDTLDVQRMRMVVNAWATDADLDWAREAYAKPRTFVSEGGVPRTIDVIYNRSNIATVGNEISYNLFNVNGISVQAGTFAYYGPNATLATVLKVGGVCGAISKYAAVLSQAHGVPAFVVAQPGHAAMLYNNKDGAWEFYYDIFGLGESTKHDGSYIPWSLPVEVDTRAPSYILLYEAAAKKNPATLALSLRLGLLANEMTNVKLAQEIRQSAMQLSPLAIPVLRDYISTLKKDSATPITSYLSLSNQIITDFGNQPRAMAELLGSIEGKIKDSADAISIFKYVQDVTKTYSSITDPQQLQIELNVAKQLPSWYADYLLPALASTYSLTSLPNGQIRINNIAENMSYSVDDGKTFVYPLVLPPLPLNGVLQLPFYDLPPQDSLSATNTKKIWLRNKFVTSTLPLHSVILELP